MDDAELPSDGTFKVRLTIHCAKHLVKREFFRLPDPYAKVTIESSGQRYTTEPIKGTLDPKWNHIHDLRLGPRDPVVISVYNHRKINKKESAAFMGCVRISPSEVRRMKNAERPTRLDLQKRKATDPDSVRGYLIVSISTRDNQRRPDRSHNGQDPATSAGAKTKEDLPDGWESRTTSLGRVQFVNHVTRMTQWELPTRPAHEYTRSSDPPTDREKRSGLAHTHRINHKLNSATSNDRNSGRHRQPVTTDSDAPTDQEARKSSIHWAPSSSEPTGEAASIQKDVRRRSARHRSYLSRTGLHGQEPSDLPDNYEKRTTQQGQVYFVHRETGQQTWHDPRVPRHLDLSVENLGPLPQGWEVRYTKNGRPYYVDHKKKLTQFTDPRLLVGMDNGTGDKQTSSQSQRSRSATRWRESVPNFTQSPPTDVPLNRRSVPDLEDRVPVLDDADHVMSQSQHVTPTSRSVSRATGARMRSALLDMVQDNPSPRYKRDLAKKMKIFHREVTSYAASGHCRIEVAREEIFEESYRQVMKMRPRDLRKRLLVKFRGEEGLDYGGVAREWLYLLSHEMLNPYYGLFQYVRDDIYLLQINAVSGINPEHLSYFHFVGRVMGIALFHGHYLDGGFTMPFYKQLLGKPITLEDLVTDDPELYQSLQWILENDVELALPDQTFTVEHHGLGQHAVVELKPGGEHIRVTEENKKEYVRLYVQWRFMNGIEAQFLSVQRGLFEVVPSLLLKPFDERELELMLTGLGKIDLADWKAHTRLKHCSADNPIVVWFWRAVDSYDDERRARLLQFVTGSSRVPLAGFKALQGSTGAQGPRLFTVHLVEGSPVENLPKAHTCFNRIDIPPYESYEKLLEKLTCAVEETCGFAVE